MTRRFARKTKIYEGSLPAEDFKRAVLELATQPGAEYHHTIVNCGLQVGIRSRPQIVVVSLV